MSGTLRWFFLRPRGRAHCRALSAALRLPSRAQLYASKYARRRRASFPGGSGLPRPRQTGAAAAARPDRPLAGFCAAESGRLNRPLTAADAECAKKLTWNRENETCIGYSRVDRKISLNGKGRGPAGLTRIFCHCHRLLVQNILPQPRKMEIGFQDGMNGASYLRIK